MFARARIKEIRTTIEAVPDPGVDLETLAKVMRALGNRVLRVDQKRGCLVLSENREVLRG